MRCVFCNGELNNFDKVCPYCGKPVQQQSGYSYGTGNPYQNNPYGTQNGQSNYGQSSQPNYGQVSQPSYGQGYEMPDSVRQKSVLPVILIVAFLLIIVIGLVIFFVLRSAKNYVHELGETSSVAELNVPDPAEGFEGVTVEEMTSKDMILPGIKYGMSFSEFDDAMKEKYPELEFRDDHEENNPETGVLQDFSYYATAGNKKFSAFGVSDTAIYVVGYAKDGTLNYAMLYFGDVYATDDSEYLMYCKNSDAQEKENFGQLKASLDAQFGKGERFEDTDPEIRNSYVYRPDNNTVIALGSRKSKNEESGKYLYDTVLEYYALDGE